MGWIIHKMVVATGNRGRRVASLALQHDRCHDNVCILFSPFMQLKCYPSFSNIAWTVGVESLFQIAVIFCYFCVYEHVLSFTHTSLDIELLLHDSNNF